MDLKNKGAKQYYIRACKLMRESGMTHLEIHRRQQIALVLIRCNKSWNTVLAKKLIEEHAI